MQEKEKMPCLESPDSFSAGDLEEARVLLTNLIQSLSSDLSSTCREDVLNSIASQKTNFVFGLSSEDSEDSRLGSNLKAFAKLDLPLLLPRGTRYFDSCFDSFVFVIEQKPEIREILFSESFCRQDRDISCSQSHFGNGFRINLAFPYVIFVIKIEKCRVSLFKVYYSNKPLSLSDNSLYFPNLPDILKDGSVSMKFRKFRDSLPVGLMAEKAVLKFWRHEFSSGQMFHYQAMQMQKGFETVLKWEKNSLDDPFFVLNVDWESANFSLLELVKGVFLGKNALLRKKAKRLIVSCLRRFMRTARKNQSVEISDGKLENSFEFFLSQRIAQMREKIQNSGSHF